LAIAQQILNNDLIQENGKLRRKLELGQNFDHTSHALFTHPLFDKYSPDFEEFKQKYEKTYESVQEEQRRKLIFLQRMQEIDELNAEKDDLDEDLDAEWDPGAEFGVNEFTDFTDEEFSKMLMPKDYFKELRKSSKFVVSHDSMLGQLQARKPSYQPGKQLDKAVRYPPSLDWRKKGVVTAVKSQNGCGSCWAFATVATVESSYAVAHGELRNLSEQELLDCDLANNACNGGDLDKSFKFVHETGLMGEDAYPYVARRQNTCMLAGETTKIDAAVWLNPTEEAIIDWLNTFGPVNVGISVPPSMKQYIGGIYDPPPYDCQYKVLGTHALLVVGYGTSDDGKKYWIIKNSWGQSYGVEKGYVYMARGVNSCGVEDEPIGLLA